MAQSHQNKALAEMARVNEDRWIMEHRRDGATLDQISQMAAMPPALDDFGRFTRAGGIGRVLAEYTIGDRVRARLKEVAALTRDDTEAVRALELERLDAQATRLGGQIRKAARLETVDIHAERLLLANSAERRKLLGLDTPVVQKVEATLTVDDARSVELAALLEAAAEVES